MADQSQLLLDAIAGVEPILEEYKVGDNPFADAGAAIEYVNSVIVGWLWSDDADLEIGAELLADRPGDVDLTGARHEVRAVLDLVAQALTDHLGVAS